MSLLNNITISYIVLLKQSINSRMELIITQKTVNFLINSLTHLDKQPNITSLSQMIQYLQSEIDDHELILRYEETIKNILSLNDLFKYIQQNLKSFENFKKNKMAQGSIVDIYARRCYLALNKTKFEDLTQLWDSFRKFVSETQMQLEEQAQLDSYSFDLILNQLNFIITDKHYAIDFEKTEQFLDNQKNFNNKLSFLKAQNFARGQHPFKAINHLRKFFDQQSNLIFSGGKNDMMINKINQTVLNNVNINMTMEFYDEALDSLSESLRLSQTQSDQECINQCLIFLYEIAKKKNHIDEVWLLYVLIVQQLRLMEYSINHAVSLPNSQFILQNCLNYGSSIRYQRLSQSILTKKNIDWIYLANNSIKQLITHYEENPILHSVSFEENLWNPFLFYKINQATIVSTYNFNFLLDSVVDFLSIFQAQLILTESLFIQLFELLEIVKYITPLFILLQLLPYNPQKVLNFMSAILKPIQNIPPEVIQIIQSVSLYLFYLRNDSISYNYLQNELNKSLKIKPNPRKQKQFLINQVQEELIEIEKLYENDFDIKNEIWKLKQKCKNNQIESVYVECQLMQCLLQLKNGNDQKCEHILKKLSMKGLSRFSQKIQSTFWYVFGLLRYGQGDISESLNCFNKSCLKAIEIGYLKQIKECYFLLAKISQKNEYAQKFLGIEKLSQCCQYNSSIVNYGICKEELIDYQRKVLELIRNMTK